MEKENKYMFVCRKCGQTYSSETNYDCKCPDCKNKLERMPISRSEWIILSDADKENYKNSFLSHSKGIVDMKYIYKSATPLAWHKFTRYFRTPYSLLLLLVNFSSGNYDILTITQGILLTLFFFGSISWKKYAWSCIILADVLTILVTLINCIITQLDATYIGSFLGACIACGLEIYYYYKRKALFNGSKEDPVDAFEFKSDNLVNEHNSNKIYNELKKQEPNEIKALSEQLKSKVDDTVKFCRYCGTKLKSDAQFCHNCGRQL